MTSNTDNSGMIICTWHYFIWNSTSSEKKTPLILRNFNTSVQEDNQCTSENNIIMGSNYMWHYFILNAISNEIKPLFYY